MTDIVHDPDPIPLRQAEAPSLEVQLDALWELVEALYAGRSATLGSLQVLSTMRDIHNKFKKGK